MRLWNVLGIALLLVSISTATRRADAAPISFELELNVTSWEDHNSDNLNIWDLDVGDVAYGYGTYDDDYITGLGNEYIRFDDTGNSFTIDLGGLVYVDTDDTDYGGGVNPYLSFEDGIINGFSFDSGYGASNDEPRFAMTDSNHWRASEIGYDYAHNDVIDGTINVTITPGVGGGVVPEPTTIVLLGIGLVGLAGAEVRRRRKKKAVDNS